MLSRGSQICKLTSGTKAVYTLGFRIEDMCRPTRDKAWIPCEPQHHQQNEEPQDTDLSKGHGPEQTMLLTNHIIGSDLLLCLGRATAPGLFKAAGGKVCVTHLRLMLSHCDHRQTHLKPMKTNCSQSQASVSMRIMLGKAKPNQEAKLMTSPFSGNSLRRMIKPVKL